MDLLDCQAIESLLPGGQILRPDDEGGRLCICFLQRIAQNLQRSAVLRMIDLPEEKHQSSPGLEHWVVVHQAQY